MVKARFKEVVWERQFMTEAGSWEHTNASNFGPAWVAGVCTGDDADALTRNNPGQARRREDVVLPDSWHWLSEWIVEKGSSSDGQRRDLPLQGDSSGRAVAKEIHTDDDADSPKSLAARQTDRSGWEYGASFEDIAKGVRSGVAPTNGRMRVESLESSSQGVRRRKWIRVRVHIELPSDAHEAQRQVLHLARDNDA